MTVAAENFVDKGLNVMMMIGLFFFIAAEMDVVAARAEYVAARDTSEDNNKVEELKKTLEAKVATRWEKRQGLDKSFMPL